MAETCGIFNGCDNGTDSTWIIILIVVIVFLLFCNNGTGNGMCNNCCEHSRCF